MSPEWLWFGALVGGVALYLASIEMLSRFTSDAAAALLEDEAGDDEGEPEDADGSDAAVTDADE